MRIAVYSYGGAADSMYERFAIVYESEQGKVFEVLREDIWNRQHANYIGKHYAEERRCDFQRNPLYREPKTEEELGL